MNLIQTLSTIKPNDIYKPTQTHDDVHYVVRPFKVFGVSILEKLWLIVVKSSYIVS